MLSFDRYMGQLDDIGILRRIDGKWTDYRVANCKRGSCSTDEHRLEGFDF